MNYKYRLEEIPVDRIDDIASKKELQRRKEQKAWTEDEHDHPEAPPDDANIRSDSSGAQDPGLPKGTEEAAMTPGGQFGGPPGQYELPDLRGCV